MNIDTASPLITRTFFRTQSASLLSPVGRVVAYVGPEFPNMPPDVGDLRRNTSSFPDVLALCQANKGDSIVLLPGFDYSLTDATAFAGLVAGTTIVGAGDVMHSTAPTFTWDAAGARVDVDVANVTIAGVRLLCNGANGVTNCLDIGDAGDGFKLQGCYWNWGIDASNHAAIAMTIGAATDVRIVGNKVYGAVAGAVNNGILVSGVATGLEVAYNSMFAASAVATGLLNINAAALGVDIHNNAMHNSTASSTACIALGAAASSGFIRHNVLGVENDGTAATQGVLVGSTSLVRLYENYTAESARDRAVIVGATASD